VEAERLLTRFWASDWTEVAAVETKGMVNPLTGIANNRNLIQFPNVFDSFSPLKWLVL
jgi:hypothetical protein